MGSLPLNPSYLVISNDPNGCFSVRRFTCTCLSGNSQLISIELDRLRGDGEPLGGNVSLTEPLP
jgi:hypothetical protein